MELTVNLPDPVLVLTRKEEQLTTTTVDAPPAYQPSLLRYNSYSSVSSESSSSSFSSLASSSSSISLDTVPSSSRQTITARITLKVPSNAKSGHVLTSLTAKLVANESLAYNNGGFEQNFPVKTTLSVPLPSQLDLVNGQTYSFKAHIPCLEQMPLSVQLPDARVAYKIQVKAKLRSASLKDSWLASVLNTKTLVAQTDLLVVQAAECESDLFSNINYVSIDGIGSTCISRPPSPCLIGDTTSLCLTLPDSQSKARISKIDLALHQYSFLRSRQFFSASSTRHYKPTQIFALEWLSQPTRAAAQSAMSEKGQVVDNGSNMLEARFRIPYRAELQPDIEFGSGSVVSVSHHLQMTIHYLDSAASSLRQTRSHTCAWSITVAHPSAVSRRLTDDLPPYTPSDLSLKRAAEHITTTPSFGRSHNRM